MDEKAKNAPMSSAPFVYDKYGNVEWDKMWDSFCVLAENGGPAHRATILSSKGIQNNIDSDEYKKSAEEIINAIKKVSGYQAWDNRDGWIGIKLFNKNVAKWYSKIINSENVECKVEGSSIFLPVNDDFSLEKEIKNVVTVIAKSSDYWKFHMNDFFKLIIVIFGKDFSTGKH